MKKEINSSRLVGAWQHAFEEDTRPVEKVYRPLALELPASRGRDAFTLDENGAVLAEGFGRTDRKVKRTGNWSLDENGILTIKDEDETRKFEVIDAEEGRLVLKPL